MRKSERRPARSSGAARRIARRRLATFPALALALLAAACAVPREAPPGPRAGPPEIAADAFLTRDGLALPLRRWAPGEAAGDASATSPTTPAAPAAPAAPPKAVILALHGFNDYSNAFREIGPKLAAHGFLVYAYDQRGFGAAPHRGLWPGSARMTADAIDAARLLARRHAPARLYLLGLSMGGAVAMTALAERPDLAAGAILVAPAVRGRGHLPKWQLWALDAAVATIPWFPATGEGLNIRPTDNIGELRRMSRDRNVIKETRLDAIHGLVDLMTRAAASAPAQKTPLLLQYGLKDDLVPMTPTLAALKALPAPLAGRPTHRIAVYPDGRHMLLRDLAGDRAIADIAAWIADPAAPLPSGADRAALDRLAEAAAGE